MIGRVILAAVLSLTAGHAVAQSRSINDALDERCTTYACATTLRDVRHNDNLDLPPDLRQPMNRHDVAACVASETALGRALHRASFYLTEHEQSRGGTLTFDEAQFVRNKLFNETYFVRQVLHRVTGDGDVDQCHRLRDRAVGIVSSIMADYPVSPAG